jgi:hypothetical protein
MNKWPQAIATAGFQWCDAKPIHFDHKQDSLFALHHFLLSCTLPYSIERSSDMDLATVKSLLKSYPNFPKPGVLFWDIHSILRVPAARDFIVEQLVARYKGALSKSWCNSFQERAHAASHVF